MKVGDTITAQDLAEALEGEEGTFITQRCGQLQQVTCQHGHSITSVRALGVVETVPVQPGTNPPYSITKQSNEVWREERSRSDQGGRRATVGASN